MSLERRIKLPTMNPEQVADEIGDFIVSTVLEFGANGGVIGLSGGIDSTTVAALTKRGFDRYNAANPDKEQLELNGYIMPSSVNDGKDAEDGIMVAEFLGIEYELQSIQPLVEAYKITNPEAFEHGMEYHAGNLRSELRATVLHGKAATESKKVIGTGNKDEDYGIGYYTIFGDGAVHLSPIGNLSKRLVREMATYLGISGELVNRVPSAGLESGQTDFGDLGCHYDLVEMVIEGKDQGFSTDELAVHSQVLPLFERDQKQYVDMYGEAMFDSPRQMVIDLMWRHSTAAKKVQLVSPRVAEVTLHYN